MRESVRRYKQFKGESKEQTILDKVYFCEFKNFFKNTASSIVGEGSQLNLQLTEFI